MHISYPNARDLARAEERGVPPGDMIMLHGTPLDEEYPEWFFHTLRLDRGLHCAGRTPTCRKSGSWYATAR
ncbi:hypothetical protein SSTU70S_01542 [Stutzerimonas stutzeri]